MTVEEEYLDVLQNIEFAIVSTYHGHPEMVDAHVIRALEAVIGSYRAEMAGGRRRNSPGHWWRPIFVEPFATCANGGSAGFARTIWSQVSKLWHPSLLRSRRSCSASSGFSNRSTAGTRAAASAGT